MRVAIFSASASRVEQFLQRRRYLGRPTCQGQRASGQHDEPLETVRQHLTDRILDNELFQLMAKPKELTPIMISRYYPGKEYGSHVDDALMQGMRTDLSFTVFLTDPAAYKGGELII